MNTLSLKTHLEMLIDKYGPAQCPTWELICSAEGLGVEVDCILAPGTVLLNYDAVAEKMVPLFPWRQNRRYIELRKIILSKTIENISMARVRNFSMQGTAIRELLYREFDLLQWMTGCEIESIFASIRDDELAANLAIRMKSGICCGMELSVALMGSEIAIDRHEFISERGVACDQVVDSVVRPDSVYVFGEKAQKYTDTDAELFGLNEEEITLVRSAHEVLLHPDTYATALEIHCRLVGLVDMALNSARLCRRLEAEGANA